jgi:hypothetical protein
MYEGAELPVDGHMWEPCLHHTESMHSDTLKEPCFDMYYNHRESGMTAVDPKPIPYALVVSLKAPEVANLYDRVVRAYAQVLLPIRPKLRIPVRV